MIKIDKTIALLIGGRLVQTLLAVVTLRLMTSLLSQQEVGNQYLIYSILLWFSLVLINPVGMFVNRHLHEWKQNQQLYFFIKQLNTYFAIIAVLSLPVVFVIRNYFQVGLFLPNLEILGFIVCYIYFSTWFQTLVSVFNLFDHQKTFVVLNAISVGSGLVFAALGTVLFEPSAIVWMAGLLLGQLGALLLALYIFQLKFPRKAYNLIPEKSDLFSKATLKFCYPIAITTLFMWFMNQGYRLIIEKNLGTEVLASIGVGLGVAASLAAVVESVSTQYFYPQYYAALPGSSLAQRSEAWELLWKKTFAVFVPCSFLMVSVSYLVIRVLTAAKFHDVAVLVWYGAFIELFRQLSNIAYLVSHAEKKTHHTIIPYMIGAGFVAAGLALLIYKNMLNLTLILVTLVCAGFLTYVYNLIVVKKLINNRFDFSVVVIAVVVSVPLLIPIPFLTVQDSWPVLFGAGALSGLWCLGGTYFLLKRTF